MACWMGAIKKTSGNREIRDPVQKKIDEEEPRAKAMARRIRLMQKRIRRAKNGNKRYQKWWRSWRKKEARKRAIARMKAKYGLD